MAPQGQAEYDFCQCWPNKPRISAREQNGEYIVYTYNVKGVTSEAYRSVSWAEAYAEGRRLADNW